MLKRLPLLARLRDVLGREELAYCRRHGNLDCDKPVCFDEHP